METVFVAPLELTEPVVGEWDGVDDICAAREAELLAVESDFDNQQGWLAKGIQC